MPPAPMTDPKAFAEAYADLIDKGFYPGSDKRVPAKGIFGAAGEMARICNMTPDGVRRRVAKVRIAGFGDIIDAAEKRYWERQKAGAEIAPKVDPVAEHRLAGEIRRLRSENKQLLEQLQGHGDFSAAVAGLSDPLDPVTFQRREHGESHSETAVLFLSDTQWGEVIDIAVMDGLNSYNTEIARARLDRVFSTWSELLTRHWAGVPPERIILVLGGDMISGEIHEELAKTNSLLSIPALRDCAAHICAGVRVLHAAAPKALIDIISLPGNHGRTTRKPESKLYAAHSYDTLCADLVELEFKQNGTWPKWFRMWKPSSGDALIWIYGYRVLLTHGDRIGSRGGAGFVGTAATVARGFKKLVMDYAGRGISLDFIMCGHFHTALQLEEGICNGCLPGPSEYSRDLRFRPRPAVQAFVTFHPNRGVTQIRWVNVGDASEGEIYAPKQPPADGGKPRFRIPAVGEKV